MKHSLFSDCLPLVCLVALVASAACHDAPPALSPKVLDCQYHVLDAYLGGNQALVERVQSVGQGPFQVEELVDVLAELQRSDAQIIDAGAALVACLPKAPAPVGDAGAP